MAGKRVALRYEQHINVPTSRFRAVENGVTLVRATRWGLSAVVDACGRELACLDHFAANERVMIA